MTELITDTIGDEEKGIQEYGGGELTGIIKGDDWRASFQFSIEASDENSVKQRAEEVIKRLKEIDNVENL